MASPLDIQAVLKTLSSAYPDKKHNETTLKLYYELLADIPPRILDKAARLHIRSSVWFPRIAELRQLAARIAGSNDFTSLLTSASSKDDLASQALALEQAFYREGCLDSRAWGTLVDKFQRAGRHQRAEHTRQKHIRLESIRVSRMAG